MQIYQSKYPRLTGSSYSEIERGARTVYKELARETKRNPYLRSVYFKKEKVFLKLYWDHLNQKKRRDRKRRLQYYRSGLDLLQNSTYQPESKPNPNGKNELVYRFAGKTKDGHLFYVQIKEDRQGKNKHLMSIYPAP